MLFVWGSQVKLYGVPTGLAASTPSDIMRVVMASSHGTIMDLGKECGNRHALKGEDVYPVLRTITGAIVNRTYGVHKNLYV